MADICPSCGQDGVQQITHFAQCIYCGKRWDLTSGEYMADAPTFPGGGVTVGMTTTETFGTGKASGETEVAEAEVDLHTWTKAELQDALDAQGVDYPSGATKAELIELFE